MRPGVTCERCHGPGATQHCRRTGWPIQCFAQSRAPIREGSSASLRRVPPSSTTRKLEPRARDRRSCFGPIRAHRPNGEPLFYGERKAHVYDLPRCTYRRSPAFGSLLHRPMLTCHADAPAAPSTCHRAKRESCLPCTCARCPSRRILNLPTIGSGSIKQVSNRSTPRAFRIRRVVGIYNDSPL